MDRVLFAETPSRFLVSLGAECVDGLQGLAAELDVPVTAIGEVGGEDIRIEVNGVTLVRARVDDLLPRWKTALWDAVSGGRE